MYGYQDPELRFFDRHTLKKVLFLKVRTQIHNDTRTPTQQGGESTRAP